MTAEWMDYLSRRDGWADIMEQLTEIEQEKTAAVSRGDVNAVDACMKREQALSMSLRGMDQKRARMLAQLGLENIPLREQEEHAPKGMEMETKAVAEKLRQGYALFQGVSQLARDTLECHLRALEKAQQGEPLVVEDQPRQADFRA